MTLTDGEIELFALAREHIAAERLPRTMPASVVAGPGDGMKCSLCDRIITHKHIEYELAADNGVTYWFHIRCHAIWQLAASDPGGLC